jgi:hypothetical protein
MKLTWTSLLLTMAAAGVCQAAVPQFEKGVKLQAEGKDIDVEIGHLVPVVTDWNHDGKKDLLVGQFKNGAIRLYLNEGTDADPKFGMFSYLQAAGKDIRLSAG